MKDYSSTKEVEPLLNRSAEERSELSYQNTTNHNNGLPEDEAQEEEQQWQRPPLFPSKDFVWALLSLSWVFFCVGVLIANTGTSGSGRASPRAYLFSSPSSSSCDYSVKKSLESLGSRLQGRVLFPEEEQEFDAATKLFNRLYYTQLPPCAVVEPYSAQDVSLALSVLIQLEREYGVRFSVKSGGHCFAKWSSAPHGVMLSLSKLNEFSLTKPEHPGSSSSTAVVATLGPGATMGDVLKHGLEEQGFAGVVGSASGVAMGGFMLGGGFGYWSRRYGLGIDNVLEMQVVLADSSIVTASANEHSDLFWALRGAGQANFGVVTQYKYRLYPCQPEMLQVMGQLPHAQAAKLFNTLGHDETRLPYNCFMETGSDEDGIALFFGCLGSTHQELYEGQTAISSLLRQTLPLADATSFLYTTVSWLEAASEETVEFDGFIVQYWNGFLMKEDNNIETWKTVVDALWEMGKGNEYVSTAVELRGGAIARVDSTATAFPWRRALYNIGAFVYVASEEPRAQEIFQQEVAHVNSIWVKKVSPYLQGTFANYAMDSLGDMSATKAAKMAWDGNLHRLGKVKAKYDPLNAFHSALTIPLPERSH